MRHNWYPLHTYIHGCSLPWLDTGILIWSEHTNGSIHFLYLVIVQITSTTGSSKTMYYTFQSFSYSWLITGCVTRLTRRVSLVEQELLTLPEHLSSPSVFSGGRVTRSLGLCVCFVDRCLSFCTFLFDHCVVCSSSIYEFWLPLWYLQTLFLHCLK